MSLNPACQSLFDGSIAFLSSINSQLSVVVNRANKISEKLGKLAGDLDLGEMLNRFSLPEVHILTTAEYLDLILGCPIVTCMMPGALGSVSLLETYMGVHGIIDPNNPPPEIQTIVQPYVDAANIAARAAQAKAALEVSKQLSMSPLGGIARAKEAFDTFVKNSGIYQLIAVTNSTLACLISKYPEAEQDPNVFRYNQLKSQLSFDANGNVQTMTNQQQAVMNDCSSLRAELSATAFQ